MEAEVALRLVANLHQPGVLDALADGAFASKQKTKGDVITVSRNIFLPLTNLCRQPLYVLQLCQTARLRRGPYLFPGRGVRDGARWGGHGMHRGADVPGGQARGRLPEPSGMAGGAGLWDHRRSRARGLQGRPEGGHASPHQRGDSFLRRDAGAAPSERLHGVDDGDHQHPPARQGKGPLLCPGQGTGGANSDARGGGRIANSVYQRAPLGHRGERCRARSDP